jgi:uncharacterized protein
VTQEQTEDFLSIIGDLLDSEPVQRMKLYTHHGHTTCYAHCVSVAYYSYEFAISSGANVNLRSLVRGALLHDLFLYDWHEKNAGHPQQFHGFQHPAIALKNAEKYFDIDGIQHDIIIHHMWPLTPVPPLTKEGCIVTMADKYCAVAERFCFMPAHSELGGKEF